MGNVTVAEFKRRFAELVDQVRFHGDRIIVARRNTPVAALISLDDLARLDRLPKEDARSGLEAKPKGLLAAIGAWAEFPDMERIMNEVYASRRRAIDRPVPPLDE